MKCLLVHNSATMRRILANALREIGCDEIIESPDRDQAPELCDEKTDLVITEWSLSGTNGIDSVKQIRAEEKNSHIRILMVSARNSKEDVTEAIEVGVNGYILKPFTAETLRLKLEQFLPADGSESTEPTHPASSEAAEEADPPLPEPAEESDPSPPEPAEKALSGSAKDEEE